MEAYEESVAFLGTWGRFQKRIFIMVCLTAIPSGYNILCMVFLLATPPHHCHIPTHLNLSQDWIQASIPVQEVDGQLERSSCRRYDLDLIQNLSALGTIVELGHNLSALVSNQEGCKDGWTYSTEFYQSTVVSEFNLVCDDTWKNPMSTLLYFVGGLFGAIVSGPIADRFGRKTVLFGGFTIMSVFSAAVAFAPSWPVFVVLFFVMGMGEISSYMAGFVLGSEILVGPPRVIFSSLGYPCLYVFSEMLLCVTAALISNWRSLSLIIAVPGVACIPLWWFVPESPRWLVSQGRLKEAEIVLRSAAKINKVEAPDVIFPMVTVEKPIKKKEEAVGCMDLIRTANVRNVMLILWTIWFCDNVSNYGLTFNMSTLVGTPFLNYFLVVTFELLAYIASWLAARRLPRRLSFAGFTLLGAVAPLLIQITLHLQCHPAVTLFMVILGKFGIIAGNSLLYLLSAELCPTFMRNTAMSSCGTFCRLGSFVSPFLVHLAVFYEYLPWILVSSLLVLSVLLTVFLPETFRQPLPDTIQQMGLTLPCSCTSKPPSDDDDGESAEDQSITNKIISSTRL